MPSPCFFLFFLFNLRLLLFESPTSFFCIGGTAQTKLLIREAALRQTWGGSWAEQISFFFRELAHVGGEPRRETEVKITVKGA